MAQSPKKKGPVYSAPDCFCLMGRVTTRTSLLGFF